MAASRISSVKSNKSRSISTALAAAVLEWLLICMLFINAVLSYLITKFAGYCELQVPCFLCSRLDHILDGKKLRYYWDLICSKHKLEISSLVLCRAHNKLVDVHGMCEHCLFSFTTINKSNAETYRLLMGKLGEDSSYAADEELLGGGHFSSNRLCSCCNQSWIPRGHIQKLFSIRSFGFEATDPDVPLSGASEHDWNKRKKSKWSVFDQAARKKNLEFDHLSHVVYTELKNHSDAENHTDNESSSEDDDEANATIRGTNPQEDVAVRYVQPEPRIINLAEDLAQEKLIDQVSATEPSILGTQLQPNAARLSATILCTNGSEEISQQQVNRKADQTALPELISIDEVPPSKESNLIPHEDVPPSSASGESPLEASEKGEIISADHVSSSSDFTEMSVERKESKFISQADILPSSPELETPVQGLSKSNAVTMGEVGQMSTTDSDGIIKAGSSPAETTETNPISYDDGQQAANLLDLGDAYKLAVGSRGRHLSGVLAEQWIGKDSSKVSEDFKILLSQLSAARDQLNNEQSPRLSMSPRVSVSPRVSINSGELRTSDASTSIGLQTLQKRISLERNESFQSLEGSIVSEIEGESVVDHLKRQVEHDKKLLSALYKELEEERSASTIAANQAMAMITRLQEEKATLQMEALQCLRMMEEQAEYDLEALQKTNDLLTDREKEIQDLEAELDYYRIKYPEDTILEGTMESVPGMNVMGTRVDDLGTGSAEDGVGTSRNHDTKKTDISHEVEVNNRSAVDKNMDIMETLTSEFEDERLYILQSLKKLEKKIHSFSSRTQPNNDEGERLNQLKELKSKLGVHPKSGAEDNVTSMQKDTGSVPVQRTFSALEKSESIKTDEFYGGPSSPAAPGAVDVESLANEVSDLNERLEALEEDHNLIEHTINSIRNGEEGLRFIQEIASQLKELRKVWDKKGTR